MKLIKAATTPLSQAREVAGLLSCQVEYQVKSASGQLDYTGPKFDPLMWHQVLSFFRWTHKEMQSESQVRLYVNLKLGRWGAWAFPQEARTGMTAREIATPETAEQAVERFASWDSQPSGDWLYFCTVHHHCSASAFQSGTDEANEKNQDGLHLTVGRLDQERHDLHARFYLAGNCFEPDLSRFWPIESELAGQVPATMLDQLARFQMGQKVVVDFPEAWRRHVIEPPRAARSLVGRSEYPLDDWNLRPLELAHWQRSELALKEIWEASAASSLGQEEVLTALEYAINDPSLNLIVEACLKHQVTPDELLAELEQAQPQESFHQLGF